MSLVEENKELNDILSKPAGMDGDVPAIPRGRAPRYAEDPSDKKTANSGLSQWTTVDGLKFYPAGKTTDKLEPGLYEPSYDQNRGYFFLRLHVKTEGLLRFPETNSERVITEIQTFWTRESKYKQYGLTYKRGMILWGPPGSGKSSTIQLIVEDVINRGGIALKFSEPNVFTDCIRIFREIQPTTPVVVLMEDIDSILEMYCESEVLNILDGVERVEKVVYLATTNYPGQLGERIINRPSRFDRRFKMPHPGKASRLMYFNHLLTPELVKEHDIDVNKWVKDTDRMSIAHLKELFTSVCIMGFSYKETIEILQSMKERIKENESGAMGFLRGGVNDEE
jgi:hypothetical protein